MASPSLVVIPPTPVHPLPSSGTRPSPTTTATYSSAPATPELPPVDSDMLPRKSSETVDRIFSMYGSPGGDWTVGSPEDHVSLTPSNGFRYSVFPPHQRPISNGLAYMEEPAYAPAPPAEEVHIRAPKPHKAGPRRSLVESQRSSGPVYTLDDHDDTHARPAVPLSQSRGPTPAHSRPPSAFRSDARSRPPSQHNSPAEHQQSPAFPDPSPAPRLSVHPSSQPHTPGSRRSSQHRKSNPHSDNDEGRPLPPPPATSAPRSPTPSAAGLLSPNPKPPSPPSSHRTQSQRTAASSSISHGPSEGEDSESFFVRNTYAQLDLSGVKGDGYEEGVERTRARVGGSRASEMRAQGALGDGTEKTKELTAEELALLSSLDRYGFFVTPSHDRLVLLPSTPLLKPIARTAAASTNGPANATIVPKLPTPTIPPKEAERIAKWGRMVRPLARDNGGNIELWTVDAAKGRKLRERVYKGIPDRWRAAAWDLLMGRFAQTDQRGLRDMREAYREALDKPSTYDIQIDLDVPRTISGHVMFRTRYGMGQRSLFHVLHCFSLRCPDCGYVQGMGPIAATLLCYLDPERVYASMVRLHDAYEMHTIFSPGFPGLLEAIYVQERVTEQMMPGVYAAFKRHMVSTTSYATKWYITLFANSVPFQTQLRLWDAFLLEGQDVFVVIALAIVWAYRDHISTSGATFETILSLLSSFFIPEDDDVLLLWIAKVLGDAKLRASMKNWRAEWKGLVASGKEGDALL